MKETWRRKASSKTKEVQMFTNALLINRCMVQNQVWLGQSSNYVCSNEGCTNITVSTEELAEGMEQHSNCLCSNEDAKMKPSKLDDA